MVFQESAAKVAIGFFENTAFGHVTEVPRVANHRLYRCSVVLVILTPGNRLRRCKVLIIILKLTNYKLRRCNV